MNSIRKVLTDRHDTGTSPLRHAVNPSMGRSVANIVLAHGSRGEAPISWLRYVDYSDIRIIEREQNTLSFLLLKVDRHP